MNRYQNYTGKSLLSRNRYFGFLIGCVLVLLIPDGAYARATWEYRVVHAGLNARQLENLLNTNGSDGWELVQINSNGVAIFKRRLVQSVGRVRKRVF